MSNEQLLRDALQELLKLHDNEVFTASAWNDAMETARAALAAQPAEGGEVVATIRVVDETGHGAKDWEFVGVNGIYELPVGEHKLYTTPPASQEQAQQPSTQAWANETGLRQIECPSCGDLAVAYDPQQPSGEVVDRSDAVNLARNLIEVRECKGITPSGVRVLCDAVLRMDAALLTLAAPKPEPSGEVVDFEAACIGHARLDGNEYKLFSMRRSPLMADGQLHPIYAFSEEIVERHHQLLQGATPKPEPMTDGVRDKLFTFMNEAAGDGLVMSGIDAGELFFELFPDHGITKGQA